VELHLPEALVREGIAELDLHIEGQLEDGDPTVRIIDQAAQPPRLVAVVTDHRTDHFSLRLEGYTFHDVEWPEAHQALLVSDFCKIVAGYLRGEGTVGEIRRLLGFLDRVHPYLLTRNRWQDLDGRGSGIVGARCREGKAGRDVAQAGS
jgi:hypothetical protein